MAWLSVLPLIKFVYAYEQLHFPWAEVWGFESPSGRHMLSFPKQLLKSDHIVHVWGLVEVTELHHIREETRFSEEFHYASLGNCLEKSIQRGYCVVCSIHHDIPVTMHTPAAYGQWSKFDHNGDNQLAVSEMNAVVREQLAFQMLALLKKYLYRQSPCSKSWDSKCLALIAQIVRAFGMNPEVGVRVCLRSRHFLSQKLWHFPRNIRSCVENECCCRTQ